MSTYVSSSSSSGSGSEFPLAESQYTAVFGRNKHGEVFIDDNTLVEMIERMHDGDIWEYEEMEEDSEQEICISASDTEGLTGVRGKSNVGSRERVVVKKT